MYPRRVYIDLMIPQSVIAQLCIVVHDLILSLHDLGVVLEVHVSRNEAAIQFHNLGDL